MTRSLQLTSATLFGCAFFGASLLNACDPQASTEYQGETLLTLKGSVELGETLVEGPLVPALVFFGPPESDEMYIVDVEVEGEFPAAFALRVYAPPPPAAMLQEEEGGTLVAGGFITAVPADHPNVIQVARESDVQFLGNQDDQFLYQRGWCLSETNGSGCFNEEWLCPELAFDEATCTLSQVSGDPDLKDDPWDRFAGLSQNYQVFYADDHVRPNEPSAAFLQEPDGIAPGYHLVAVRPRTPDEREAWSVCMDERSALALERYNAAHGTSFSKADLALNDCNQLPELPQCSGDMESELWALEAAAFLELQCGFDQTKLTLIDHPENEQLSVRLGRDISFPGF